MTLVCLPKSHFTSNPHGEDDEEDGEEDGAGVEEEDPKEEAEERRRPRQGKAINYGFAPDFSLLNIQHIWRRKNLR